MVILLSAGEDVPERLTDAFSSIDGSGLIQFLVAAVIISPVAFLIARALLKEKD